MMKKSILVLSILLAGIPALFGRDVTVNVTDRDAESVFRDVVRRSGKNYVYPSGLLKGMKVSVKAKDEPLAEVLRRMFAGTDIVFTIKGDNVTLRRKPASKPRKVAISGRVLEASTSEPLVGALVAPPQSRSGVFTNASGFFSLHLPPGEASLSVSYPGFTPRRVKVSVPSERPVEIVLSPDTIDGGTSLAEVVVTADINRSIAMRSPDVGRLSLNVTDVRDTPVIFGEADIMKTLQMQPGVSQGMEGMAGMYVHGGAADENLVLLDGVPIYQPSHFGGLFSSFNVDVVKNVDFYKTSFPAAYGGRLSSVLDVHTKEGSSAGHHGSARLGLTSGAFNIDGPLGRNTTYSFAIRRSWYEALSVPALAIYNRVRDDDYNQTIARYAFMDINAKVSHTFSKGGRLRAMFYFGDDYLKGGEKTREKSESEETEVMTSDIARLHWGNILGSVAYSHPFTTSLFGDFSLSVSHFSSMIRRNMENLEMSREPDKSEYENTLYKSAREFKTSNNITDVIARGAFTWNASPSQRVDFGAEYIRHYFKPQEEATAVYNGRDTYLSNLTEENLSANEAAVYISDDWDVSGPVRISAGLRGGFYSSGHSHFTLDPRFGIRWALNDFWTLKASYACMTQYERQLSENFLALPTDIWVPVAGNMKPERSHGVSAGAYWTFGGGYTLSAEAYWRWLRNLADYPDYYYLAPKNTPWYDLLASGEGRARGLDFAISKRFGKITGQLSYSLLWADRRFDGKNDGKWYPDRFDNRHKINISVSWDLNSRWTLNALWTGMSGNRYTLQEQNYQLLPDGDMPYIDSEWSGSPEIVGELNGRRLPFYNRLDLSATLRTRRGEWTFSLYNAYCNMNPIAVRKHFWANRLPYFDYLRLIPVIPGVSYTWFF